MEISAALAADLGLLTEVLNDADADIATTLLGLERTIRATVSSYLGLTARADGGGEPFTFTTLRRRGDQKSAGASLSMSLPDPSSDGVDPILALTLYAANPGAFVDLAADLGWFTGLSPATFVLDAGQTWLQRNSMLTLVQKTTIDQAVGVLIGNGRTPDEAHREIGVRAANAGTERHVVAREILSALNATDQAPE